MQVISSGREGMKGLRTKNGDARRVDDELRDEDEEDNEKILRFLKGAVACKEYARFTSFLFRFVAFFPPRASFVRSNFFVLDG